MIKPNSRIWTGPLIALVGLLMLTSSSGHGCDYALKSTQLLQCRPIKLLEGVGADHKAAWTYIDDRTTPDGVLAHMLCVCQTTLQNPDPQCEPRQTHKVTFTLPTS